MDCKAVNEMYHKAEGRSECLARVNYSQRTEQTTSQEEDTMAGADRIAWSVTEQSVSLSTEQIVKQMTKLIIGRGLNIRVLGREWSKLPVEEFASSRFVNKGGQPGL